MKKLIIVTVVCILTAGGCLFARNAIMMKRKPNPDVLVRKHAPELFNALDAMHKVTVTGEITCTEREWDWIEANAYVALSKAKGIDPKNPPK